MYENFVSDQTPVRKMLEEHFIKTGKGMTQVATEIGICYMSMTSFFSRGKNLRLKQLTKVIRYLQERKSDEG